MANLKQELDEWLDQVNYKDLNDHSYSPSEFSLYFMNFIKLVNGSIGESNKTPPFHLKMLDKIIGPSDYIVNLCFRGAAKTTVFFEYFALFLAVFGHLPKFGDVTGMIYVSDTMENGVKAARKNIEFRYNHSDFLREWIPEAKFTDNYLEFKNKDGHVLGIKMFGAKTGLRGTKIFGKRPVLAVLDDLVSDEDAGSKVQMQAIKDTVYNGVEYALDPTRRKVIFNGTPFNKEDIMIEAVESGVWDVNVWPVCERFPCLEEEFVGAWEDRFSYEKVKDMYERAVGNGKSAGFMQEMMLRITSDEERLVLDSEIRQIPRSKILEHKSNYNFYITTDFATSDKDSADYSVISVWAYTSNGDWIWVDGIVKRQTMDKTIDDLFRLVQEYNPQSVGIEITGQQGAFIKWLQGEMIDRNIWFNFASSAGNNSPGIRPVNNKLARFNLVVPLFKAGKIYFAEELLNTEALRQFYAQIRLATINGLKGKDDCLDTISMLMYLNAWKPSSSEIVNVSGFNHWLDEEPKEDNSLDSYIV